MLGNKTESGKATKCTKAFSMVIVMAMVFGGFLGIVSTDIGSRNAVAATGTSPFYFIHITDLHVDDGTSIGEDDEDGVVFGQMMDRICALSPKPAFVVASGDICHAGESNTAQYSDVVQHLFPNTTLTNPGPGAYYADEARTIPVYFVAGNHDYRETNAPPYTDTTPENYPAQMGPLGDYVIDQGNAVVIMLNSGYDQTLTGDLLQPEGSGLTDAQMTWLHDRLVAAGSKRKIIVMHNPAVNIPGTNWDGTPFNNNPTGGDVLIENQGDGAIGYNRVQFLNECDNFSVDVVLTGHVHQYVVCDRNGNRVSENWAGGTRYVQTAQGFQGCYRWISVDSSSVFVWQKGDVNGDGIIALYDVIYLLNVYAETPGYTLTNPIAGDINGNGRVDLYDVIYLLNAYAETPGYTL